MYADILKNSDEFKNITIIKPYKINNQWGLAYVEQRVGADIKFSI